MPWLKLRLSMPRKRFKERRGPCFFVVCRSKSTSNRLGDTRILIVLTFYYHWSRKKKRNKKNFQGLKIFGGGEEDMVLRGDQTNGQRSRWTNRYWVPEVEDNLCKLAMHWVFWLLLMWVKYVYVPQQWVNLEAGQERGTMIIWLSG